MQRRQAEIHRDQRIKLRSRKSGWKAGSMGKKRSVPLGGFADEDDASNAGPWAVKSFDEVAKNLGNRELGDLFDHLFKTEIAWRAERSKPGSDGIASTNETIDRLVSIRVRFETLLAELREKERQGQNERKGLEALKK